ncbi:hypothetical protein J4E93_002966 [Alternaria ventricosa]|uniref:uncharacterized protein n=1 Tax=Alternaria ventricosa TaxID=1187951 RepID=UPI0020C44870|nr:uncharacterized protein J4E93_002966 [Alternaria ventricosa]KAI4650609.1 hypothetical protein J4E93_002966 [Alternaria ventricosa]
MSIKRVLVYAFAISLLPCLITSAATPSKEESRVNINFTSLLDGSLGYLPALWLTSQGVLAELQTVSEYDPLTSRQHRTDKENGAVTGAFVGSMLVPLVTNLAESDTATQGICKSLVAGATGSLGAVVGQEAGKLLYPANRTSASEFEQAIVPGTFFGGVTTNAAGTALTKTLCKGLVPGLEKLWENAGTGVEGRVADSLHRGFQEVVTSRLREMGANPAQASRFASQMGETMGLVDRTNLGTAFERLNRELVADSLDLVQAAGAETIERTAIRDLIGLSHNTLADLPGSIPGMTLPFDPPAERMGMATKFASQLKMHLDFAKKFDKKMQNGANKLHDIVDDVLSRMKSVLDSTGVTDAARKMKEITEPARERLRKLPNPFKKNCNPENPSTVDNQNPTICARGLVDQCCPICPTCPDAPAVPEPPAVPASPAPVVETVYATVYTTLTFANTIVDVIEQLEYLTETISHHVTQTIPHHVTETVQQIENVQVEVPQYVPIPQYITQTFQQIENVQVQITQYVTQTIPFTVTYHEVEHKSKKPCKFWC